MRWKFRLLDLECVGEPLSAEVFEGTAEEAMARAAAVRDEGTRVFAATEGPPGPFVLPPAWRLVDIARVPRGWKASHGLFASARRAASYELQRDYSHPSCLRVLRRDGTVAQVLLHPGNGRTAQYEGHG